MLGSILFVLTTLLIGTEADSCSFSTTITASSAISQLNACPTLDGKIKVTGGNIGSIDLSNVEELKADMNLFNSSSVTDINLNKLQKISGSLNIQAYTQLHSVDLTSLSNVEQLSLISLPSFAILNLNTGISKASTIELSDTALSSLQGFNFNNVDTLNINNNKNISSIDLQVLESVSENLILSFNSDEAEVILDELIWASNLTIQDVAELSISNLTTVNGSFVLGYNTFGSVELDNLKDVGGSLQIFANDDMTEFSFKKLKSIGGELRIYNNTELSDMEDSFKSLQVIKGAVNVNGKFDNFTLSSLKEVDGDFTVVSTSDEFSCKDFEKLHSDKKIEGHNFKCSAPTKSSSSTSKSSSKSSTRGSSSTESSSSSSSGSSSSGSSTSKKSEGTNLICGSMAMATLLGSVMAAFI